MLFNVHLQYCGSIMFHVVNLIGVQVEFVELHADTHFYCIPTYIFILYISYILYISSIYIYFIFIFYIYYNCFIFLMFLLILFLNDSKKFDNITEKKSLRAFTLITVQCMIYKNTAKRIRKYDLRSQPNTTKNKHSKIIRKNK